MDTKTVVFSTLLANKILAKIQFVPVWCSQCVALWMKCIYEWSTHKSSIKKKEDTHTNLFRLHEILREKYLYSPHHIGLLDSNSQIPADDNEPSCVKDGILQSTQWAQRLSQMAAKDVAWDALVQFKHNYPENPDKFKSDPLWCSEKKSPFFAPTVQNWCLLQGDKISIILFMKVKLPGSEIFILMCTNWCILSVLFYCRMLHTHILWFAHICVKSLFTYQWGWG